MVDGAIDTLASGRPGQHTRLRRRIAGRDLGLDAVARLEIEVERMALFDCESGDLGLQIARAALAAS